jgi:hypothetical protein
VRKLNSQQGMIGGGMVALKSATGAVGRSPDPLATFASTLACAGDVVLVVVVNRSSKPPVHW